MQSSSSSRSFKPGLIGASPITDAILSAYVDRGADDLAHQAVKYQQRDGWSHGDLLRRAQEKRHDVENVTSAGASPAASTI